MKNWPDHQAVQILVCLTLFLLVLPACAQTKVMLIGDSFWQNDGMRQAIYDGLHTHDVEFDFVGSEGRGEGPVGIRSSVPDPDHEGIAAIRHTVPGTL